MATRAELLRRLKRLERPSADVDGLQEELAALQAGCEAARARALAPGAPRQVLQDFILSMSAQGGTIHMRISELEAKVMSPAQRVAAATRAAEITAMSPAELAALVAERQARPGPTSGG